MIYYVLDVMRVIDREGLPDRMNLGFNDSILDRFRFRKVDESISNIINNDLDVLLVFVLDLVRDGVSGISPGLPQLPHFLRNSKSEILNP